MRKFLALMVILLAILGALLQFVLPRTVETIVAEQITNSTAAKDVTISLSANPNARIALGEIDKVHGTADEGRIGDIVFKNLTVDGEKISLDVPELLFPSSNLTARERTNKILQHAEKIELRGIVTEDELKNFVSRRDIDLENSTVKVTPEAVEAAASVKFLGRTIDVTVSGIFTVSNGEVFFHINKLNTNSILSRVNLDSFVSDFKIIDSSNLPIGLKFDSVELREGEIVVTAVASKK